MAALGKPLDLRRLLDAAPEPVFVVGPADHLAYCNGACAEVLGLPAAELLGKNGQQLGLCPPPAVHAAGQATVRVFLPRPDGPPLACQATFIALGMTTFDEGRLARAAPGTFEPRGVLGWLSPDDPAQEKRADAARLDSAALHAQLRAFRASCREHYALAGLVGGSPLAARIRAQAAVAAASTASVLIVGPRGSGREHLARAIHHAAPARDEATLVTLDCRLLPGDRLRERLSQLSQRPHRAAATATADLTTAAGTLLLLNVDQAPPEAQAELEALLNQRRLPLRVLATSVKESPLRPELAILLSTIAIELPPLVARLEDLPLLAQAALEECNAVGGKQLAGFSPAALERLVSYDWPGQLDELQQLVREAHATAPGTHIDAADLPERVALSAAGRRSPRREQPLALDDFLVEIETELLRRALQQARGNKAKAARLLGVTRPRLYRRLVQLGLEPRGEET